MARRLKRVYTNRKLAPLVDDEITYTDMWLRAGKTLKQIGGELGYGNYITFSNALARKGYTMGQCLVALPDDFHERKAISKAARISRYGDQNGEEWYRLARDVCLGRGRPEMARVEYIIRQFVRGLEKHLREVDKKPNMDDPPVEEA